MSKDTYYGSKNLKYYNSLTIDYDGAFTENMSGAYNVTVSGDYQLDIGDDYIVNADDYAIIRSGMNTSSSNKSLYLQSRNGGNVWITADYGGTSGDLNLISNNQMNITTTSGGVDGSDINISCGQDLLTSADGTISITSGNDSSLSAKNIYMEAKNGGDVTMKSGNDIFCISNDRIKLHPNNDADGSSENAIVQVGNYGRLWFHDGKSSQTSPNFHFGIYRYRNSSAMNQMIINLNESNSGILIHNNNSQTGEIKLQNYITKKIVLSPYSFLVRDEDDLDSSLEPMNSATLRGFKISTAKNFALFIDLASVLPDLSIFVSAVVYVRTTNTWAPGETIPITITTRKVQWSNPPSTTDPNPSPTSNERYIVGDFPQDSLGSLDIPTSTWKSYSLTYSDDSYIIDHNEMKQLFLHVKFVGTYQGNGEYEVHGVKIFYKTKNPTCFGSTDNYPKYFV